MTPTPAPNDDVSVNVSPADNGNQLSTCVDAVCAKEYVWDFCVCVFFCLNFLTDVGDSGSALWRCFLFFFCF